MDYTYLYINLEDGSVEESDDGPNSEDTTNSIDGLLLVIRIPDPVRAEILDPIDADDVDSWGHVEDDILNGEAH